MGIVSSWSNQFDKEVVNLTNILRSGILCANTESDDEIFIDVGGHHVEFSRGIYRRQKLLIQLA